jgi:D-alanine-D-alanine ligase
MKASMRVLIVFDYISEGSTPDQSDALVQARAIASALEDLGHEWMTLGVTPDLEAVREAIARLQPDVVFNLVESLGGQGRLIDVVPALLDALGVPYTGATSEAQFITSHKPLAKQLMRAAGISTPPWHTVESLRRVIAAGETPIASTRWIIKSMWEHASVGLGDDSLVTTGDAPTLLHAIEQRRDALGGAAFAEQYIDGREFNIALLTRGSAEMEPESLPPAEIVFFDYAPGQPRLVDYGTKWDEDSFGYQHTLRRLDFERDDAPLLERLDHIARDCWRAFDLTGYARVDFRIDHAGRPWVLEVNTDPCLSPDAGFAAALAHANMGYTQAIDRIVRDAASRARRANSCQAST